MRVYKASFYKGGSRISGSPAGDSRLSFDTPPEQDNVFILFGDMDYVMVNEEIDFSDMVDYQSAAEYKDERFLRDTLFLLDLFDSGIPLVDRKELRESYLYQICALKLNYPLLSGCDNYKEMVIAVRDAMVTSLKPFEALGGIVEYYGSSGAFDIVLVCAAHQLSTLLSIQAILRNTFVSVEDGEQPLFSIINTYNITSSALNFDRLCDEVCNADIQIAFKEKTLPMDEVERRFRDLIAKYRKSLPVPTEKKPCNFKMTFKSSSCNSDMVVHISNISLSDVLHLHPYWENTDKEYADWYRTSFLHTNTTFFAEFKAVTEVKTDISISLQPNKQQLLNIIREQYDLLIENDLIPEASIHDFKVLVDTCRYLLLSSRQHIAGKRFACILYYAFETILERYDSLEPMAVNTCLHDICMSTNMAIQSDSIQLDNMDKKSINASNSVSKFLYSLESILQSFRRTIIEKAKVRAGSDTTVKLRDGSDVFVFFTIGLADSINSKFYFRSEPGELPKYVSINMPNTGYFDVRYSTPYIYHELGHYVALEKGDKPIRNNAYYELIKKYITIYTYDTAYQYYGGEVSIIEVKRFFDCFFEFSKGPNVEIGSLDDFVADVLSHINNCFCEMTIFVKERELYEFNILLSAIRSLLDDEGYLYLYDHLFRETHADVVMVVLGNLDAVGYLKELYRSMEYKKLTPNMENKYTSERVWPNLDKGVQFRVSAMLMLLSPEKDAADYVDSLSENEFMFFERTFFVLSTNKRILSTLVEYLKIIYDRLKNDFSPYEIPKYGSMPFGELVASFMDLWYNNAKYWHEQASDIVASHESAQGR